MPGYDFSCYYCTPFFDKCSDLVTWCGNTDIKAVSYFSQRMEQEGVTGEALIFAYHFML